MSTRNDTQSGQQTVSAIRWHMDKTPVIFAANVRTRANLLLVGSMGALFLLCAIVLVRFLAGKYLPEGAGVFYPSLALGTIVFGVLALWLYTRGTRQLRLVRASANTRLLELNDPKKGHVQLRSPFHVMARHDYVYRYRQGKVPRLWMGFYDHSGTCLLTLQLTLGPFSSIPHGFPADTTGTISQMSNRHYWKYGFCSPNTCNFNG